MVDGMMVLKGIFTIGAALLIATIGPLALSLSVDAAAKANANIPAFAQPFAQRPWLLSLVAIPAVVCGVLMAMTRRYRWTALIVSTLVLLFVLAVVLVVFLQAITTAYSDAMKPL